MAVSFLRVAAVQLTCMQSDAGRGLRNLFGRDVTQQGVSAGQ